ncbi:MAG: PASTA domain-containing protein [Deltaproteobacteria bacterium]|nr:PASTA domain-containing protein [Deltaproteobacteria bacterium]
MRRALRANRRRLICSWVLFGLFFVAVAGRAFQLQILQGEDLKRLGARQHLKEWIVLPKRGSVYDRAGEALALSSEAQSVYARPRRIDNPTEVSRSLAKILHLNVNEVRAKLESDKPFIWIKRQIAAAEAEKMQALKVDGLGMSFEPNRYYPQGQLAGHVLGFVNRDSDGMEGLELRYNNFVRGESGSSMAERDALGRRVLVQGVEGLQIPPGGDLHLTLDMSIQHLAEKELEATIVKHRAKAGVAIVVEPHTGEVLALANYPFFNPNDFSKQSASERRNRAVTDSFEPGSTFKTMLAAAALEEDVVGKEDLFYCEMGKYAYGGRLIHDSHPHGWLPFHKVLQVSSNIGFTKVAQKMNRERYFRYIEKFGFGKTTGIDLPGEVPGLLRRVESWSQVDLATHAYGQGIATTPMQMAMAYAAIANGGFLMRPYVVRRVLGPKGEVLQENQPQVVRRVISEKTAKLVASMLKGVTTEGGTGTSASVEGFDVAGKTGTSQKADLIHGGYSKKRIASFVGFVPADSPRFVILVLVDEPEGAVYGGVVAAPAFQNIARGALRHRGVAPKHHEAIPSKVVQEQAQGQPVLKRAALKEAAPERSDGAATPDFVGLSLREAVDKARSLNVRVKMQGAGYVVRQSPAPGGRWGSDNVLVLKLEG